MFAKTHNICEKSLHSAPIVTSAVYLALNTPIRTVFALLDTGSEINLISPEILPKFPHIFVGEKPLTINGSTNSVTQTDKIALVVIELANCRRIAVPFFVRKPNKLDIILGQPYCKQTNTVLYPDDRLVRSLVGDFAWETNVNAVCMSIPVDLLPESLMQELTEEQWEKLNSVVQGCTLSEAGQRKVMKLLVRYRKIWTRSGVGQAKGIQMEIDLADHRPVVLAPRHIPLDFQKPLDAEIDKMLADNVIVHSDSPYCAYPVIVPKPDGSLRIAVDYKKLNDVTIRDKRPLPRIEDLIQFLEGSVFFALLDLRAGFWQIPVHPKSQQCTAFRTHRGLYQFKVMPFGLTNAPAVFQRWTNDMFRDLRYSGVLVYIDDILIHAATEERFLELFEEVLRRLEEYGAQVKIEKCVVCPYSFKYLGHQIENGFRRPNPKKVDALYRLKSPKDIKELRSVLGTLGFFRPYIPHMSELSATMTCLLRKDVPFVWTPREQTSLEWMAHQLASAVLRFSPSGQSFRLETDASDVALGAVLFDKDHYDSCKNPIPLMFMSKCLSAAESNWDTAEREAYAIIWGLETADQFVRGRSVDVVTDHKNLTFMMTKKRGKVARWKSRLCEYHVNIIYRCGKENTVADCLSRMVEKDPLEKDSMFCYAQIVTLGDSFKEFGPNATPDTQVIDLDADDEEQQGLEELEIKWQEKRSKSGDFTDKHMSLWPIVVPSEPTLEEIRLQQNLDPPKEFNPKLFSTSNNMLIYNRRLWVPPALRLRLLDVVHLSYPCWHPGSRKMLSILKNLYYWKDITSDIGQYLRSCLTCQRIKLTAVIRTDPIRRHPVDGPFQSVYIDLWGPINWRSTEKRSLMTMIDHATKWVEAVPISDKSSKTLAKAFFTQWICRFGAPRRTMVDNDIVMFSKDMAHLSSLFGIYQLRTTVYHPEGNSPIESFHRILKRIMSSLEQDLPNSITLEEAVSWALFRYRATPHDSILDNPAYMTLGVDVRIGSSAFCYQTRDPSAFDNRLQCLQEMRLALQQRFALLQAISLKKAQPEAAPGFNIGDLFLLSLNDRQHRRYSKIVGSSKLAPKWSLPLRVIHLKSPTKQTAILRCPITHWTTEAHISNCRKIMPPISPGLQYLWDNTINQLKEVFEDVYRTKRRANGSPKPDTAKRQRQNVGGGD